MPTVIIHQLKVARFDVIDRAKQSMRAQVMAMEDQAVFDALDGIFRCVHRIPIHECHEPECVVRSVIES